MSYAFDIPGYAMGHRFSDDPKFYDGGRFLGQAGYGSEEDAIISVGTPTFDTINGERALLLDNQCQGYFHSPTPFLGSAIIVLKPNYVSGSTQTIYPWIFGEGAPTSNTSINLQYFSPNRRVRLTSEAAKIQTTDSRNDDQAVVIALAMDPSTNSGYSSVDGSTVTAAAATATSYGRHNTWRSAQSGVRFGNLSGTAGDTTANGTFNLHVFEQHFYQGNILTDHLAETAAFMASLKTKYGI